MSRKLVCMILLVILSIFILAINSMCLYIILASKRLLKSPPTLLIMNSIVIHLIQGAIVLPLYASFQYFDNVSWLCNGYEFTYMMTFYANCITVLLLSIDRLLAIKLLTSYCITVTRSRAMKLVILCWTYVLGVCIIPFFPLEKSKTVRDTKECNYNPPQVWSIVMLIFNTLVPYIVIIIIYVIVRQKISALINFSGRKSNRVSRISSNRASGHKSSSNKESRNTLKTTMLVLKLLLSCAITWSPSILYIMTQHLDPSLFPESYYGSDLERSISFSMKYVSILNAMVAPIVYCIYHKGLRIQLRNANKFSSSKKKKERNFRATLLLGSLR